MDIIESQYGIFKYVIEKKNEAVLFPVLFEDKKMDLDVKLFNNAPVHKNVRETYGNINTSFENLNDSQKYILLQIGSKAFFMCFSLLAKLYPAADEEGFKSVDSGLVRTITEKDINEAMEKIYTNYNELPKDLQDHLYDSNKDKLLDIIYGDTLFLDRELTAIKKAEVAAQDFYGNSNPDNIVAIVYGEAHDFSNACKQLSCTGLTAVTFEGDQAYEQVIIA
jgi:hypothetical protein